ncbi:MAG TPA: rhodanese-like domain-containing protein [Thermoanaerobaculia bacterium]|nr:rhodanese-like domain-containing protein [Thermoanaerobaculia bacterium]
MKKALVLSCILALPVLAQMKPATPAPGTARPAPAGRAPLSVPGARSNTAPTFARISIDDAVKLQKAGKAVFVDVRSNEQFSYGHIKGSLSLPGSQLIRRFNEVTPGKTVITYCACTAEQSSGRAAADLMGHGVKNVFALKGGWTEWRDRGLPTAVGPK